MMNYSWQYYSDQQAKEVMNHWRQEQVQDPWAKWEDLWMEEGLQLQLGRDQEVELTNWKHQDQWVVWATLRPGPVQQQQVHRCWKIEVDIGPMFDTESLNLEVAHSQGELET